MTALVILAAGKGTRMGGNKPLHPWGHSTLIETVIDRLSPQASALAVNADPARADDLHRLGLPLIFDAPATAGRGPLSGVLSALVWAGDHGEAFVVTAPCDMPDLPTDLVARLMMAPEADIVYFSGARDYPLCARWATGLHPRLQAALAGVADGLKVMRFIEGCRHIALPAGDDQAFANINHPDERP